MKKEKEQKQERICENPNCKKKYIPYNKRQRICGKLECKGWLQEQNTYKPKRYRIKGHEDIIVTQADLIPLED